MKYFTNIKSLSDLKKQYRALAVANHPDKGGDTVTMQDINAEFSELFSIWQDNDKKNGIRTDEGDDHTTASTFSKSVYEENGWTGERYYTHDRGEIVAGVREWLKQTYPHYSFSVNRTGWAQINIVIRSFDFNPFNGKEQAYFKVPNLKWYPERCNEINERAKAVVLDIWSYVNSYNYNYSDLMSDYHDVNFYLTISLGSYNTPFKVEVLRRYRTGGTAEASFVWREGPAHRALKKVLGNKVFEAVDTPRFRDNGLFLGQYKFYSDEGRFYPMTYSQPSIQERMIKKLACAGIICEPVGRYIKFIRYTDDMGASLAAEDAERAAAEKAFYEAQKSQDTPTASQPAEETDSAASADGATPAKGLRLVDIAGGVAVEADDWRTTYFNRRAIKAHGCRWNKEAKQWQATDPDAIAALRAWFGQDCTTKDGNGPETLQSCNTAYGPIEAPVIPPVENHQSKACADAAPVEAVVDDNTTTKPTAVLPDWLRVGNIVRVGPYACQIDEVDLSRDTVTYHCEVDDAPVVVQSIKYFVRQKENTRVAEINIPDWFSVGSRVVWLGQVHTVSTLCPSSCTRTGYFVMFEGCDDWADPSAITSYTSPDAPPDPAGGGIPDDGTAPKHVSADYSTSPDSPVFVLATEKCNIDTCTKVSSLEDVDLLYRHGINLCKGCNFEFAASCTEERLTTCNLQLKALL